jgi:tetratricopeptide (TPR) repeat protein
MWHEVQSNWCWNNRQWLAALPHYQQLAKLGVVNLWNYGVVLCEAGRFDDGAEQFEKGMEVEPDEFWYWYAAAVARLHAGSLVEYRSLRDKMIPHFRDTDDPRIAADVAKICLLGAKDDEPQPILLELADRAMEKEAGHPVSEFIRLAKALADYRAGRFDDAAALAQQLIDGPEQPEKTASARFILAMTQWRQEKHDEAKSSLAAAVKYCNEHPQQGGAGSWLGRALTDIIRRDAEELLTDAPSERTE